MISGGWDDWQIAKEGWVHQGPKTAVAVLARVLERDIQRERERERERDTRDVPGLKHLKTLKSE